MNWRTTLILLAVLVVLGAAVYWFEVRPRQEESVATPTPSADTVWSLAASDVAAFRVQATDSGLATGLARQDSEDWKIVEPFGLPADQAQALSLVSTLSNLRVGRTIDQPEADLSSYGLVTPTHRIELTTVTGETLQLKIGDLDPGGSNYYAQREGEAQVLALPRYEVERLLAVVVDPPRLETPAPTPQAVTVP